MTQIEAQKFQLQNNIDWEAIAVANQTKVKLYDQLIEGFVELREALEKVEVEFKRWHFKQVKNYVSVLDVAYQQIAPNEEIEDDIAIEGEAKQVKKEGKSDKVVQKGKKVPTNVDIVDISNEDETTPLSQLYFQSAIKEEPGNEK
jgi:hypothetical protein